MRKYLISALLVTVICPLLFLAWNSLTPRASAQQGMDHPIKPIVVQPSRILSAEVAQSPENPTAIQVGTSPASETAAAKIEAALDSVTEIDLKEVPLSEFVEFL